MYTKQDSIFWWNLERYIGKDKRFKFLTLTRKSFLENVFKLAYYGLMQYQIYKGSQLQAIELSKIDQIIEYIDKNFDLLVKNFLKDERNKKYSQRDKQEFLDLIAELVLPYINDFSFESMEEFRITNENIQAFIMQLAIKNQFDINIFNDDEEIPESPYYSQIYPFMVSLMILNPTDPKKIYENIRDFYTLETIQEYYDNGRTLKEEEIEILSPQIDLLNNPEDYNYFLFNFSEENWSKADLQTRFKLVFQLTKLTTIFLKENISSITFLDNETDLYELIEFYLPIILRSEDELIAYRNGDKEYYFEKKAHPNFHFLRPWLIKDFDPRAIQLYYAEMKVYDVQFELEKLYKMMDMSLYASSYIRLLTLLGNDSVFLQNVLIENKKLALVNTLKIFELQHEKYHQIQDYTFHLNDVFLDLLTLKKLEGLKIISSIKHNLLPKRMDSILKLLSYMLALVPARVKEFGYSLDEFVRYYLILYGPYRKTRLGYKTNDFFLLTKKIIETVWAFKSKELTHQTSEQELIEDGYYLHIYLIEKLLEFSKITD